MILGPKGTGKSSIAHAICIRLNWPPKILGCAAELPPFVKIGAESGHIEIELKRLKGEGNLVIMRMLSAKTKSSTFTIGWKSASEAEVTERVARLNNVQVSGFAAMWPVELLRETQNAVGEERLKGWHATFVEAGAQLKEVTDVDVASYFLITTKLLPDLEHYERMKVLCVNNGEWLPEESSLGNMMGMINGFVAKNPGRG